jgi:O-antigen/teichoic acid export membrane protein
MMFAGLILPALTATWAERNLERFKRVMQKSFDFLVIIIVPAIFGTFFLGERLMRVVAGDDFALSGTILKILILGAGVIFLGTLFGHIIVAIKKQRLMIWGYAAIAAISLASYIALIPKYTYWAAAWITVFSEGAIALLTFFVVWKTTKITPSGKIFLKSVAASLLMSGVIYLLLPINLFLLVCLGAAVYFIALYLFRGYSRETITEIIKIGRE